MKTRPSLKLTLLAVAGLLLAQPFITGGGLQAQNSTAEKVRLMADALRAYDAGDYAASQRTIAELLRIAPGEPNVLRLKQKVDAAAAQQAAAAPAPAPAPAPTVERTATPEPAAASTPAPAPSASTNPPPLRPTKDQPPRRVAAADPAPASGGGTSSVVEEETKRINDSITRAKNAQNIARGQASRGETANAISTYDYAISILSPNSITQPLIDELKKEKAALGGAPISREPVMMSTGNTDAGFAAETAAVEAMLQRGRSQFLAGDVAGAEATFKDVEARDANNAEAKNFLMRIAQMRRDQGWLDRSKTREQMLEEVSRQWQRPGIVEERRSTPTDTKGPVPLLEKLNRITIPQVNFTGVELSRVVSTLSNVSEEFDNTDIQPRGVNIVLIDPQRVNPAVNITLRNLTLKRVLDFITDSVGFQYEVQLDAVVVRPGGEITNLDTDVFPVSRATVIRMVNASTIASMRAPAGADPFAPAPAGGKSAGAGESESIRNFLQQAGVNFETIPGSSLVYDGSAMIVTQSSRNLAKIRTILNRYNDVRQVEIEAKFLDVADGVLEEAGIQWNVNRANRSGQSYQSANRTLSDAFSPSGTSGNGSIILPGETSPIPIISSPATFPGGLDLAKGASALGIINGSIGNFDVDATVRALARKSGTDLLSAPKVTVVSGIPANITVAQEFRYPESYGNIESQVGQSSAGSSSGSAGVTITAGTPQDFKTRNVGVELTVTPTVEEDDYSISLDLNPRVTEFDGFVEYGGQSIAISGGTTVTVPSGFFQPIFSVREMKTKVTIWDGATVVMGGLTREEVKQVNDKVPVLGDMPFLGRLFRSKGESNQKRNLLIFVTANLISPGGSLKKQEVRGIPPSSLFQNPTIVTPSGSVDRNKK